MKSKEEIEQLAKKEYNYLTEYEQMHNQKIVVIDAYIDGYTQCQEDMAKESIAFANFLIGDFEMDEDDKGNLVWRLAGTNQKYTTEQMYDEFIKIWTNPHFHPST